MRSLLGTYYFHGFLHFQWFHILVCTLRSWEKQAANITERSVGLFRNWWFGEDVQIETPFVSEPAVLVHGGDETSETDAGNEPKGFTFFFCWEMGRWGFHGAGCFQRNWPGIRESPLFLSSFALLYYMCLYKISEFFYM